MNFLLDTHIWLWSVLGDGRLSGRVARELRSPANRLWLSPISVWEALLLCERGRLTPAEDAEAWVKMALTAIPLTEAPFTHDVALATRTKSVLLIAIPQIGYWWPRPRSLGLTLVTADKRLDPGPSSAGAREPVTTSFFLAGSRYARLKNRFDRFGRAPVGWSRKPSRNNLNFQRLPIAAVPANWTSEFYHSLYCHLPSQVIPAHNAGVQKCRPSVLAIRAGLASAAANAIFSNTLVGTTFGNLRGSAKLPR